MKTLLAPGICLLLVAGALKTGVFSPNAAALEYIFYGLCAAGLLLAWRFHSSRIFSALVVLFLSERAVSYFSSLVPAGHALASEPGRTVLALVGVLLPLNFVLISLQQELGFTLPSLAPAAVWLFVQSVIVAVVCSPRPTLGARAVHPAAAPASLPFAVVLAFSAAGVVVLIRLILFRKPAESGLLWTLAAVLLGLRADSGTASVAYFAAAAFILAAAVVETSYLLAYHDELTTLPSRRAFHEALLRLEHPYSIAMVDIDHFKRCNDTHGHDTGDQVLRMVASRLSRVSGGGQAFRCGGEEFAIIFAGKTATETMDDLEKLREAIAASKLRLRGPDRRQQPRGPDRRNQKGRSRGQAIRQLSRAATPSEISVTASIGVASSEVVNGSPEKVIQAADKALYRAKDGGRNRIETASPQRKAARAKTAGIA